MARPKLSITRRAIRLTQNAKHPLYVFSLTGSEILQVADISIRLGTGGSVPLETALCCLS